VEAVSISAQFRIARDGPQVDDADIGLPSSKWAEIGTRVSAIESG
jgi:hypothetical protein